MQSWSAEEAIEGIERNTVLPAKVIQTNGIGKELPIPRRFDDNTEKGPHDIAADYCWSGAGVL